MIRGWFVFLENLWPVIILLGIRIPPILEGSILNGSELSGTPSVPMILEQTFLSVSLSR